MPSSLWKKAALIPPLLLALYLLADHDDGSRLAVWTALQRHPPSLRVYRALLELTLLLAGTAASLYVWSRTVGDKVVGQLLFESPQIQNSTTHARGRYRPVASSVESDDEESDGEEGYDTAVSRVVSEEEAMDADYVSDGEVPMPSAATNDIAKPPPASVVAGAALDSLAFILLSLFAFTISSAEGGRYIEGMEHVTTFQMISRIAAPVFPLALFVAAVLQSVLPWQKRKDFWTVICFTVGAPFYKVTFRDGFIGDILTSSVRPMQDIAFTIFYIMSGLQGWWTQAYDLDDAAMPLEKSWLLHTVILPACMVSPLWWRFLQNLNQSYENKQRWPYLGNALKYFVAAEVAMFGVFDPNRKRNTVWILSFVGATLYQIWWDVFMDWELLELGTNKLLKLRSLRLYPSKCMYWTILVINFILRFCWTLSFLPPRYLNRSGMLSSSFDGDISKFIGPAIASAEIVRRTLWGLLRLELEAIRTHRDDKTVVAQLVRCSDRDATDAGIELQIVPAKSHHDSLPPMLFSSLPAGAVLPFELKNDMSTLSELQILGELCVWATAFASLGIVAAAHRETL